jgi:hypothetical protein
LDAAWTLRMFRGRLALPHETFGVWTALTKPF